MANQVIAAFATYLVAFLAISLGALIGARRPAVALAAGWGLAVMALVIFGTLTDYGLSSILVGLAGLSLCGLFRWRRLDWHAALPVLVLGLPYLAIAASLTPAGYDEYAHWLPNILYLERYDHFPSLAGSQSISIHPGYPYGSAIIGLAVSRLTGLLAETAVINWNALLNLALGGLACETILRRTAVTSRWRAAAIGLLATGILSPAFVASLYLSNYGDAITGQLAAIMAAAILFDGLAPSRWTDCLVIGLTASAVVSIRQDSFSIFGIVLIAWAILLIWRAQGRPSPVHLLRLGASLPAPLITWWLWNRYQLVQIPRGVAEILPWEAWHWPELPAMLRSILTVLAQKCGYTLVLACTLGFGLFHRKISPQTRESALFGALIGLGHIASMVGIYLAVETGGEPARVAPEFWRFTQHIAPAVILCALPLLPVEWITARRMRYVPVLALLIECAAFPWLRVDAPNPKHAAYADLRRIGQNLADWLPSDARLSMVETNAQAGMIPEIFFLRYRYLALRPQTAPGDIFLVADNPPKVVTIDATMPKAARFDGIPADVDFAWIADGGAASSRIMGMDLPSGQSYLLRRDGDRFLVQSKWPRRLADQPNGNKTSPLQPLLSLLGGRA